MVYAVFASVSLRTRVKSPVYVKQAGKGGAHVLSDPIGDMLTRIRNANMARHTTVDIPSSKIKESIASILVKEGYVKNYEVIENGVKKTMRIT